MPDDSRSSTGTATPAWIDWAMPSAADLIFVALLCALVFTPLSVRLLGDAGIGWHIRTGQQILATHAVPRVDSFSSTMAVRPMSVEPLSVESWSVKPWSVKTWFAWEWLYDLVVGQLEATLGLNGVVWLTAVVIAAVFAWMFRLLMARGANVLMALVLVLVALWASAIHFLARPHVVSWLFTLAWFWILDSSERECWKNSGERPQGLKPLLKTDALSQRWKRCATQNRVFQQAVWLLPLLMLVWVNVHGGFLIGLVLLGIFLLGAAWTWFKAKDARIEELLQKIAAGKRARSLAWVGLLSVGASLVNPYGWNLHRHIYSYLSNRFLMDHIDEFQSPNFHGAAQKCFLALLLMTMAVLVMRGRELRLSQGLTVLFAVYAGLYASRNIPVSSILLVMVVGPMVPAAGFGREFFERMGAVEAALRVHLWAILAIAFTLLIAVNGGRVGSTLLMDAHFDPRRMPVEAVNYLEKSELKGPVLSPDYWGGYLIYRLYPKTRVVVDDRHDFYGEEFFKSYLKMMHVESGWEEFLRAHETSCVLLPRDAALASMLAVTKGWKTIYADDVAIVFVREP
jgi:hypothetical protein